MIRLNAFFQLKEDVKPKQVFEYSDELIEKSLKDEGNISYDLFKSSTRKGVMMFCETWKDQAALDAHSQSAHFTTLVPKIEALTANGMKVEQFEF
jgi:quinol monooxygenase YgiN